MPTEHARDWTAWAGAPATGTPLCPLAALADCAAREFTFGAAAEPPFAMLVIRRRDDVRGYVNVCPHQNLPLNNRSDRVVSPGGARILCTNHQADFALDDGRVLSGPMPASCALTSVPVHVDADGMVRIGPGPGLDVLNGTAVPATLHLAEEQKSG